MTLKLEKTSIKSRVLALLFEIKVSICNAQKNEAELHFRLTGYTLFLFKKHIFSVP